MHSVQVMILCYVLCNFVVNGFNHLQYQRYVRFVFYDELSNPIFQSNDTLPNNLTNCNPTDKLAIIVHGWRESCFTPWIPQLVQQLNRHRGGCIICMDYREYSLYSYYSLVSHFEGIVSVLTDKLQQLQQALYDPAKMFLFGFSYGGQLVLDAGQRFGDRQLHQIDACEPAGPGFDRNITYQLHSRPQAAAANVQCIHTSYDKGTAKRVCHQNWNMGRCGWSQPAAGSPPLGSHGLCPYIYVSAFENRFRGVPKAAECPVTQRDQADWMEAVLEAGYYMGYDENRTNNISGEFYAPTSRSNPFNVVYNLSDDGLNTV